MEADWRTLPSTCNQHQRRRRYVGIQHVLPPDLGSWPLPPGFQLRPAGPTYFTCIGDQTWPAGPTYFTCIGDQTWPAGPTYFTCIGDQTRPAGPTYFTCIGDQIWPAGLTYFTCIGDQTFQKCSYPDTMAVYHTEFTLSEAYITLIRKQKLFTPHPPPQKKEAEGGQSTLKTCIIVLSTPQGVRICTVSRNPKSH